MGAPFIAALAVFLIDRLTKIVLVKGLACGQSIKIIPGAFHLTLVFNNGTAFGLLKGYNILLIALSLAVIIYIAAYLKKDITRNNAINLALGLVAGGAIGNLVDRVTLGYVIDFLDLRVWPVFNVADSAITIGAAILAWKLLQKIR